jgi:phosphoribosylglycinamide formyltransferase-1
MRIAIFISGRGSTMQALLDNLFVLRYSLVVSSKADAPGLLRARRQGIPTLVLDKKIDYEALHQELLQRKIDRIFLAGFMKIVPPEFIKKWSGKIVNIHPSLLPLFPGLSGFEKSFENRADMGATLHEVTEDLDAGPILRQFCFYSKARWQKENIDLNRAQTYLSFCEQRLVREVSHIWK